MLLLQFFAGYTLLLKSDNYVTRRQSLKVSSRAWLRNYHPCGVQHLAYIMCTRPAVSS